MILGHHLHQSLPYDPPLHWPSDSDKCAAITGDREEKYHLVCPMIIKYLLSTKVAQKLEIARVSNQKSGESHLWREREAS